MQDNGDLAMPITVDGVAAGGPTLAMAPTSVNIANAIGTTSAVWNSCVAVNVRLMNGGAALTTPLAMPINLQFNAGGYFTDNTCTTAAVSGPATVSSGLSQLTYYVRSNSMSNVISAQPVLAATPTAVAFSYFQVSAFANNASIMSSNTCYPVQLQSVTPTNYVPEAISVTLTTNNPTNLYYNTSYFYSDSGCSAPVSNPTLTMSANSNTSPSTQAYVKLVPSLTTTGGPWSWFTVTGQGVNSPFVMGSAGVNCSGTTCL